MCTCIFRIFLNVQKRKCKVIEKSRIRMFQKKYIKGKIAEGSRKKGHKRRLKKIIEVKILRIDKIQKRIKYTIIRDLIIRKINEILERTKK